jgi:excisionase family DNA binding protein
VSIEIQIEPLPRLAFTVKEAAEILGLGEHTVYDLVAAGRLTKVPYVGNRVLIARVELERFAAQGLQSGSGTSGS